jgi:mannose/cellobiose epimerase-like protein (N-acyl-D-glucosamine 2-epimerase family)
LTAIVSPADALRRLRGFVNERALPLWATAGFDEKAGCFHERLEFSGQAVENVPRRLLVQSRQIAVFARVSVEGWSDRGKQQALQAFETTCRNYRSPDDHPGWIFSVGEDGQPVDRTRDLYAHAFVLFMLAWMYRLTGEASVMSLADRTISEVDQIFDTEGGDGYLSRIPGADDIREQNPHMHLFEGFLALAEATGAERYLSRAGTMVDLFKRHFFDAPTGALREFFDSNWRPVLPSGKNRVEPGHQMEWVWLLREWQRLTGSRVDDSIGALISHAIAHGIDTDTGLVRGAVREDGAVDSNASRVWTKTETIRALCREDPDGVTWPGVVSKVTTRLFSVHLPLELNGGWIDQVDHEGIATVNYMPASSLYHLVGATIDGVKAVGVTSP